MRRLAAAATIIACLGVSHVIGQAGGVSVTDLAGAVTASAFSLERAPVIGKQTRGAKPTRGNDSCRWAHDNECDDPDIGTGACTMGTDFSDCRALRAGENDSCRWARDGECDEPNFGTGACVQGTDRTDCGQISWMRNQTDNCATSFNDICEEPGRGSSGCAVRTDRSDCHGRNRPLTINDHFFGRDDRVRVNAQQAPWRFMGRFINGAGESCSATLIARDVIVTAAHCIHTDGGVEAGGRFEPAAGGGQARSTAYMVNPRFDYRLFNAGDEIDGLDWALLRLDSPVGGRLGFAGVRNLTGDGRTAARAADLYQAGYSWDTGDTLSANERCHMVEIYPDHTFAHECDTTRGDSGSSFVVRSGRGFEVIGVDSNFRSNPSGPFIYIAVSAASFQPFVADFVAGRSGLPIGRAVRGKPPR
jgi:protease YdgD